MIRWNRSLPFARPERGALLKDILIGAVGGALGTFAMNQAQALMAKLGESKQQDASPQQEPATEKAARKLAEPVGVHLEGEQKKRAGNAVHWSYGTLWGAIHGAMHERVPLAGRLFGVGFGLGLFLFGDELAVPVLGLAPPPQKVPVKTHLSALAAHLVYGTAAEGTYRVVRRALS
ncbi:DUF1440 domain-containing protein [Corallococcus terminator]|uniref:DUF1440 domain-containing protein n=1 Tax=Corallococcus terminator TaxID=2316733 RepID=A0A3A8I600_9BACT|nr:DUF1440 domain-containing protein [Corallococcus terminator]RKG73113.1 DUF1440 domain-containing protein [Corallococcus terminator]